MKKHTFTLWQSFLNDPESLLYVVHTQRTVLAPVRTSEEPVRQVPRTTIRPTLIQIILADSIIVKFEVGVGGGWRRDRGGASVFSCKLSSSKNQSSEVAMWRLYRRRNFALLSPSHMQQPSYVHTQKKSSLAFEAACFEPSFSICYKSLKVLINFEFAFAQMKWGFFWWLPIFFCDFLPFQLAIALTWFQHYQNAFSPRSIVKVNRQTTNQSTISNATGFHDATLLSKEILVCLQIKYFFDSTLQWKIYGKSLKQIDTKWSEMSDWLHV